MFVLPHVAPRCRRLSRWRVGQNLYQSYSSRPAANDWQAAMDSWFWSEISLFPVSSVYRYVRCAIFIYALDMLYPDMLYI